MAERVGFEPTVPLPRRMLSKHVDSSTLAPLRIEKCKGRHLSMRVQQQQGDRKVPVGKGPLCVRTVCGLQER